MAEGKRSGGGESLSLQTLVIAAAASATAAIVVSHVWREGTVIAAAMTPVIVSIVKELLARPMESELVKKPVQQVSSRIASGRRVAVGRGGGGAGTAPRTPERYPPAEPPAARPDPGALNGDMTQGDPLMSPRRTYGRPRRGRRLHVKLAIVTGLLAFAIAAAVLTLPELLFGGAVTSHHSTTFFGGGSSSKSKEKDTRTTTQPEQQKPGDQTTTPATPPPTTGQKTPTTTTPAPATTTPQQTTPQQTAPVPPSPAPPTP